jgi:hypothetical protein
MPFEAWSSLGRKIARHCDATSWWLGDWLAFGQLKYGRRYKDAIAATGLDYQTLRNYAVVARRFGVSRRRDSLSFHHHAEVCALGDADQELWLDLAWERQWSKAELRRRLRAARASQRALVPVSISVTTEPQRQERWRSAAEYRHCGLRQWIVETLDRAADEALVGEPQPSRAPAVRPPLRRVG